MMRSERILSDAQMPQAKRGKRRARPGGWRRVLHITCEAEKTDRRLYRVQDDDTLQSISQRFYGSEICWPSLYLANKKVLGDSDRVSAGQILYIPDLE